ncbi:hypothetical protein PoB_000349200 [Plakobranchus ocellatus]|uniref:Uncharacterized protein n=1 Tax=Plakobranchus ocellatus TaxID=259542 RepID=A0AAV3Y4I3_9GAST|nr:hypothetical protein PoB_000349200 [Plakobranchus ocellatus]
MLNKVPKRHPGCHKSTRSPAPETDKEVKEPINLGDKSTRRTAQKTDKRVKEPINLGDKSTRRTAQKTDKGVKESINLGDKSTRRTAQKTDKGVKEPITWKRAAPVVTNGKCSGFSEVADRKTESVRVVESSSKGREV